MRSAIEICTAALNAVGAFRITSFDDNTAESDFAKTIYPVVRDGLLSSYPWSFAIEQFELSPLVAAPVADYDYAFALPAAVLRIISVGDTTSGYGRGVDYRVRGRNIETDTAAITITANVRTAPQSWPAYFDTALIALLSAEFAVPITESNTRHEAMIAVADRAVRMAKNSDAQGHTPGAIEGFSLVSVR